MLKLPRAILKPIVLSLLIGQFCPAVECYSKEMQEKSPTLSPQNDGKIKQYLDSHLIPTFTDGFDTGGMMIIGAGALAGIIAHQMDGNVNRFFTSRRRVSKSLTNLGNSFGTRYFNVIAAGVQMIWDRSNGLAHVEGLLGANLTAFVIKKSIKRKRPNGKDEDSFPSGHTATAFASSGSLGYAYGLKAAIPAYTLTALTILSRLQDNEHWFSDVVVATSIGIYWARSSGVHHHYLGPIFLKDGGGVQFSANF